MSEMDGQRARAESELQRLIDDTVITLCALKEAQKALDYETQLRDATGELDDESIPETLAYLEMLEHPPAEVLRERAQDARIDEARGN